MRFILFIAVICSVAFCFGQEENYNFCVSTPGDDIKKIIENEFDSDQIELLGIDWYKEQLAQWNPHVSNWTQIKPGTRINLEYPLSVYVPAYGKISALIQPEALTQKNSRWKTEVSIAHISQNSSNTDSATLWEAESVQDSFQGGELSISFFNKVKAQPWSFGTKVAYIQNSTISGVSFDPEYEAALVVKKRRYLGTVSPMFFASRQQYATAVKSRSGLPISSTLNLDWLGMQLSLPFKYVEMDLHGAYSLASSFKSSDTTLNNNSPTGYKVGAGLKVKIAQKFWLKVEYNKYSLSDQIDHNRTILQGKVGLTL